MKPSVRMRFGDGRSSEVFVGKGILAKAGALMAPLKPSRVFVLFDRKLSKQAAELQRALRRQGWETAGLGLTATEALKDYRRAFPIYARLLEQGLDRHSVLVALGGGVIGDFSGFIAGTYLRGIRWVGIPTTLLAQVDSSVGGKTGVNHPRGKNLIGVFHQPSKVVCDTGLLKTLSPRDRWSGIGEILKYGLAFDAPFYRFLEKNLSALARLEEPVLSRAITDSLRWKAKVVAADEYETRGLRHILNFGHTWAHALEGATGFRHYRHGEAVVVGMRLATALSHVRGVLPAQTFQAVDALLAEVPVPLFPSVKFETLEGFLKHDKKAQAGQVRFVLLKAIGKTTLDSGVRASDRRAAFHLIGEKK